MLRLKNVIIKSDYAEADFYPEDRAESGHIVVNLSNGEVEAAAEVHGFGESYASHARQQLVKMAKMKDTRKECLVMWY